MYHDTNLGKEQQVILNEGRRSGFIMTRVANNEDRQKVERNQLKQNNSFLETLMMFINAKHNGQGKGQTAHVHCVRKDAAGSATTRRLVKTVTEHRNHVMPSVQSM